MASLEGKSLDSADDQAMVKLISKDNKEFVIEKKYALLSNLVKITLETGVSLISSAQPKQLT